MSGIEKERGKHVKERIRGEEEKGEKNNKKRRGRRREDERIKEDRESEARGRKEKHSKGKDERWRREGRGCLGCPGKGGREGGAPGDSSLTEEPG